MRVAAVAFVTAAGMGALLTLAVRKVAVSRGILENGLGARRLRGRPVPRLGGIAIVLASLAPLAALAIAAPRPWPAPAIALLAGGIAIAALGTFDDLRGATAGQKLSVQLAVAAVVYAAGLRVDAVATPLGTVELGLLGAPLTLLWIAGVVNALNLLDGLDGLAGGVAFLALAALFALAAGRGDALATCVAAAVAGAVLGFLVFNLPPASIFMGDTGSLFLGFVLATLALRVTATPGGAVALLVPVVLLGLPLADTLLAVGRRALRGVPLFSADRGHLHHRLLDRGLSERRAVLALYGATWLLCAAALFLARAGPVPAALTLGAVGVAGVLALRRLGLLRARELRPLLETRRENVARRRLAGAGGPRVGARGEGDRRPAPGSYAPPRALARPVTARRSP